MSPSITLLREQHRHLYPSNSSPDWLIRQLDACAVAIDMRAGKRDAGAAE